MIVLFFALTAVYLLLVAGFINGFNKVKLFVSQEQIPATRFTIIIAFRNEVKNLESLIESLQELNYPKSLFEVILINDNSTDNSEELAIRLLNCTQLDFHIYNNVTKSKSPKKDAITLGIKHAKYQWIITTDADCIVPSNWLKSYDSFLTSSKSTMVVAPVMLLPSTSVFDQFQTLEILSLQGATIGSFGFNKPFLSNGANLCYSKELFHSLNGFQGNNDIASGDDIFLLEKALKTQPELVTYLKCNEAIVETRPEVSFSNVIQQRIRWAAKTSSYTQLFAKFVGFVVLAMNALIIASLILSIFGILTWWEFLIILISKQLIDYSLISKSAKSFGRIKVLNTYFFSSLIYPFVSIYVAFKAMFSNYQWKGRTFNK